MNKIVHYLGLDVHQETTADPHTTVGPRLRRAHFRAQRGEPERGSHRKQGKDGFHAVPDLFAICDNRVTNPGGQWRSEASDRSRSTPGEGTFSDLIRDAVESVLTTTNGHEYVPSVGGVGDSVEPAFERSEASQSEHPGSAPLARTSSCAVLQHVQHAPRNHSLSPPATLRV